MRMCLGSVEAAHRLPFLHLIRITHSLMQACWLCVWPVHALAPYPDCCVACAITWSQPRLNQTRGRVHVENERVCTFVHATCCHTQLRTCRLQPGSVFCVAPFLCRSRRPEAAPNAGFSAALVALERSELGSSSVEVRCCVHCASGTHPLLTLYLGRSVIQGCSSAHNCTIRCLPTCADLTCCDVARWDGDLF